MRFLLARLHRPQYREITDRVYVLPSKVLKFGWCCGGIVVCMAVPSLGSPGRPWNSCPGLTRHASRRMYNGTGGDVTGRTRVTPHHPGRCRRARCTVAGRVGDELA